MRTLTNGSLTVVAFDYNVYKQERNVLDCTISDTAARLLLMTINVKSGNTTLATFHVTTAGRCFIDLTDYLRVNSPGTLTVQAIYDLSEPVGSVSVDWSVAGLISPARLFVPDTPSAATIRTTAQVAHNWLLPTRVLQPTTSGDVLEVYGMPDCYLLKSTGALHPHTYYVHMEGNAANELVVVSFVIAVYQSVYGLTRTAADIQPYLTYLDNQWIYNFKDVPFLTQAGATETVTEVLAYYNEHGDPDVTLDVCNAVDEGDPDTTEKKVTGSAFDSLTIGSTIKTIGVTDDEKNIVQSVAIIPRRCGVLYAAVEWVSATGHTRRATWEVREHKQQTGDTVAIATVTNDFDIRKGREDGLTLRLDSLTAFDVWYYGDIVSSSSVRVSLDGGQTWQAVKVESKDVTIPDGDGGELQELKIQVTYAEYDAVVM